MTRPATLERGNVTILGLGLMAAAIALLLALGHLGGALVAGARAEAAADGAALAAASALGEGHACSVARERAVRIAVANGGTLRWLRCDATAAAARVAVRNATAQARAEVVPQAG